MNRLMNVIPGLEADEMVALNNMTMDLTDEQLRMFAGIYAGRRKTSDTILICTILGFVAVAGIQRFVIGQIGMGLLYLFTGGLCLIGTIVDLINYKRLTFEYNHKVAMEAMVMVGR
ncbi:MAG TPA: TM2 domain-containing protein [Chitinophagaceae bacterium]